MKYKKIISMLIIFIVVLSFTASVNGVFSSKGSGNYNYKSIRGEIVKISGNGLYKNDSVSVASQGVSQDIVTLILGIPLLLISLYFARKGSLKGKLMLTGTVGYFLYSYMSYTFLAMYNPMFLIYVLLMSSSFFAFTLLMVSYDMEKLKEAFSIKLPVRFIGGFQIFFGFALFMLWIGKIVPPLINNTAPIGLEHYTTLVIQGMDLGFIVPIAVLSGIMLIKKNAIGYLLSSVVIMKGVTMGSALVAMIIGQAAAGVKMSLIEIMMFPIVTLVIFFCLFILLKNIDENKYYTL